MADEEKTDPGGHEPPSLDLPDIVMTGRLTEDLETLANETRQLRRELRAHSANDALRWDQVTQSDRRRINDLEERVEMLEGSHPTAPPNGSA